MLPIGVLLWFIGQLVASGLTLSAGATIKYPEIPVLFGIEVFAGEQSRASVYAILAGFAGAWLFLVIWTRFAHGLRFRTLLGIERRLVLRDFFAGVAVVLLVAGIGIVTAVQFQLFRPNLPPTTWAIWLIPSLVFIFIQVFAEELVFRGYLQPVLAARFRSPLIWLVIPALLFGAAHYNPAVFGPNWPLVVFAAALMGLVAGHVTARTGNISAALGLHFANNCNGMLIVAVPGPLSALSLYLHPIGPEEVILTRGVLIGNIATILGAYGIYLWFLRRRDARLQ